MVPSGIIKGVPRDENSGSVRQERWVEEHRSKSDPARWREPEADTPPAFHAAPPGTSATVVRIEGSRVEEEEVKLDAGFDECPLLEQIGVPVHMKLLPLTPQAQMYPDARQRSAVLQCMTDEGLGLPMHWQSAGGGAAGALPPVLVGRRDSVRFGTQDWAIVRDYLDSLEEYLPNEQAALRKPTPFREFVRSAVSALALREDAPPLAFMDICPAYDRRFPIGLRVRPHGLVSRSELNGRWGVVARHDEAAGRVGVEFPRPLGLLAIRATQLECRDKERAEKLTREDKRRTKASLGRSTL